ncbi:tetratricopeptide repeat protein [Altererythrobacter sp. MF3-039]|uniref:tetratricopeptide repeat protein n=1 Tax=Altererythrobacter sp. MF3-039 TaxID=3252901 RepID=UPI00390C50EC
MSWLPILALAAVAALFAMFALKLPRQSVTLFAAALLLGLTGYALQGSPGQPSAPRAQSQVESGGGEALVAARRELFDNGQQPARYIIIADGFARQGKYADAAGLLRGAIDDQPDNAEAWVALANALVEHAEGQLTPAALFAFGKAEQARPDHPGAGYFLGVAMIRSGRVNDARELWAQMLEAAPEDTLWRPALAERLARLDALIAQMQAAPVQ